MGALREWVNRLRYLGGRSRYEDDLDVEVRFHIESRAAELEAAGLSPLEAVAKARSEFGSIARAAEDSRAAWQFRWIEDLAGDLRYGIRSFRRSPGFTVTAILSLALGIGANAAIFNAIYTVLWKPLPVSKPEELVAFSIWSDKEGKASDLPLAFVGQLRRAEIFKDVSVMSADGLSLVYDDRAERVVGEVVSPNYFDLLGVRPAAGQAFTTAVRKGIWAPEAVLSYNYWQRRFGGDPGVIGRTIRLNTYPFTIVGISPAGFFGLGRGTDFEIRIPILPDGREIDQIIQLGARPDRGLFAVARLKAGSRLPQAESSVDAQLQEFLRQATTERFRDRGAQHIKLVPAGKGDNGTLDQFHAPLYVLLVLVALVLLIACANVANMLLARAASRSRELAVRTSIGAGRFRLIRQMLAESLLLSLLAGVLAVAIGNWAAAALVHFLPQGHVATVLDLRMDATSILFVLALSLVACMTFGLAPAVRTTRGNLAGMLKSDSGGSIDGLSSGGFPKVLVVSQVAFSLVLLIAAGIFARTMLNLHPTDYGAHPEHVLLFTMKPQREIYTPERRRALSAELVRRVAELPGVEASGVAEYGPLGSRTSRDSLEAERGHSIRAETDWVTAGFFDAAGMRRVAGRDFAPTDKPGSPLVTIVNQSLARVLFGSANPLGRSIRLTEDRDARPFEIVGVVGDSRYYDIHLTPQPAAWFTFQGDPAPYMPTLHVRTSARAAAMIAEVRRELNTFDKGFPVFNVKTLEVRIDESLARERILANLSGAVGLLALVLAAVGLYGVLAYSVARRTREVGIRMALGSSIRSVLWMVAREALILIAVGSLAGVALSVAGWRILAQRVPGIAPVDLPVLTVCAGVMLAVAAAAVSVPAARACRIDPLMALRQE
jgi:predicted permease